MNSKIKDQGSGNNLAPDVVEAFGEEWARFDQSSVSDAERARTHEGYFGIFPWSALPKDAIGADIGCGSGRWAKLTAARVPQLILLDASPQALDVARRNLADMGNVKFMEESVGNLPFETASLDFAYSLGVLHHVPDTQAAVREIARVLKPDAPFLVYLYYALDNRAWWYRLLWRMSDPFRRVISSLPYHLKHTVCDVIALTVYWPLVSLARLVDKLGFDADAWPLAYYRDKSFYSMRTDALDRFGTRLEQRFTREEIRGLLEAGGFRDVIFSDKPPYWCAVGFRSRS
jgi:SAM-dependent methyltransferase